jgi:hypothetical protein
MRWTLLKKAWNMKNKKKRGHCTRNGNAKSPYAKYNKQPFNYGSDYRRNHINGSGILCRDGVPVQRHTKHLAEAAE